ncbi:MAG: MFS transporter, partial [Oscillospiraceae bacterium]|nr:MFS transporter [Oscillospiraceae bacterium]
MSNSTQKLSVRWLYLIIGVVAMLFAGIIYAWSILKAPFSAEFGWTNNNLANNFTLTMCFFCIGGLVGAQLSKRIGHRVAIIIAAVLGALGFILTASMSGASVAMLFVSYGLMAGLGI